MTRYVLYARKSSESEERQVLSIDSQLKELRDHARQKGLSVVATLSEAKSAKAPGREVFCEMLKMIHRGKADGIVCWKLDRLARNPIDGGALIWALDRGKLKEIVTREKSFTNTGDDKFWMQLEFGMAKKFVDDLSSNVKRGNRAKLEQGWVPGVPPLGYLNDRAAKTIVADSDRLPLVRKIWELALRRRAPLEIHRIANEKWSLRSPVRGKTGGRPLAVSTIYRMLSNPFYYGLIERKGETYVGSHEPVISKEEFDRVQDLLGRPNHKARKGYRFPFTSLIRCGECGSSVTAEEKTNRFGSTYRYYHCARRPRAVRCRQRVVRAESLDEQIVSILRRIRIDGEFRDWAMRHLHRLRTQGARVRTTIDQSLDAAHSETRRQAETLLDLRLKGLVSDDEFTARRKVIVEKQLSLRKQQLEADQGVKQWFEPATKAVLFANQAVKRFTNGNLAEKREILNSLGSNPTLQDGKLLIQAHKPFRLLEGRVDMSRWQAIVERIRSYFTHHPSDITWPSFCEKEETTRGGGRGSEPSPLQRAEV